MRGFAAIALHNPKTPANIGGAFRAASCFRANLLVVGGKRGHGSLSGLSTDTPKAWRQIPTISVDDVFEAMPVGGMPVAVDLLPGAHLLPDFRHPERAFYVFGPEDGTLPPHIVNRCPLAVMIPTAQCMNLAACVNVVLYDRAAKLGTAAEIAE